MKIPKSLRPIILFIVLMTFIWIFVSIYNENIKTNIERNKLITIARVDNISVGAKNLSVDYSFFIRDKRYKNGSSIDDFPKNDVLNRYYEVHVSSTNPEYSEIFLNREITDTMAIKAAGFSVKEKKKKNQFQEF